MRLARCTLQGVLIKHLSVRIPKYSSSLPLPSLFPLVRCPFCPFERRGFGALRVYNSHQGPAHRFGLVPVSSHRLTRSSILFRHPRRPAPRPSFSSFAVSPRPLLDRLPIRTPARPRCCILYNFSNPEFRDYFSPLLYRRSNLETCPRWNHQVSLPPDSRAVPFRAHAPRFRSIGPVHEPSSAACHLGSSIRIHFPISKSSPGLHPPPWISSTEQSA